MHRFGNLSSEILEDGLDKFASQQQHSYQILYKEFIKIVKSAALIHSVDTFFPFFSFLFLLFRQKQIFLEH